MNSRTNPPRASTKTGLMPRVDLDSNPGRDAEEAPLRLPDFNPETAAITGRYTLMAEGLDRAKESDDSATRHEPADKRK
jgi:hypothetical protein